MSISAYHVLNFDKYIYPNEWDNKDIFDKKHFDIINALFEFDLNFLDVLELEFMENKIEN